jgi:drug/metabolite transporter superfamily protein YnfA
VTVPQEEGQVFQLPRDGGLANERPGHAWNFVFVKKSSLMVPAASDAVPGWSSSAFGWLLSLVPVEHAGCAYAIYGVYIVASLG